MKTAVTLLPLACRLQTIARKCFTLSSRRLYTTKTPSETAAEDERVADVSGECAFRQKQTEKFFDLLMDVNSDWQLCKDMVVRALKLSTLRPHHVREIIRRGRRLQLAQQKPKNTRGWLVEARDCDTTADADTDTWKRPIELLKLIDEQQRELGMTKAYETAIATTPTTPTDEAAPQRHERLCGEDQFNEAMHALLVRKLVTRSKDEAERAMTNNEVSSEVMAQQVVSNHKIVAAMWELAAWMERHDYCLSEPNLEVLVSVCSHEATPADPTREHSAERTESIAKNRMDFITRSMELLRRRHCRLNGVSGGPAAHQTVAHQPTNVD